MNSNLYYIALLLPEKINNEILLLQNECMQKFKIKKVLTSPPHITIIPPFKVSIVELENIKTIVNQINIDFLPIYITLNNFNNFDQKNIHIIVKKNKKLNHLYKYLRSKLNLLINIKKQIFTPHISIINKDINLTEFLKAIAYYKKKEMQKYFYSSKLYILKYCQEKNIWNILDK